MGCWPSVRSRWLYYGQVLFCVFMDRHGMKWNGFRRNFSLGTRWVVPSGQDSSHSRPQRPRSFWSAPRIATSGRVQRHSGFEWLCKHKRLTSEPIRLVYQNQSDLSDGKSVNSGLPVLNQARGSDPWCWPNGARPLGTRMDSSILPARV